MSEQTPRIDKKPLSRYMGIFFVMPVLTYLGGTWVDSMLGLPKFPPFPYNLFLGFAIFGIGLFIGIKATRLLYVLGGGLPWGEARVEDQSKRLVKTGLYVYTRNPMVLGYSLLPCGMGMMFQSLGMMIIFPLSVFAVNIAIVKLKEEPRLEERFGKEYEEYRARTPFLLPQFGDVIHTSAIWRGGYLKLAVIPLLGILLLAGLTYSYHGASIPNQKVLSASIFILICIVGIIAGVYPSKVSGLFRCVRRGIRDETGIGYQGHHPTCGRFISHVNNFGFRILCAGCLGMIIGGIFGIIVTLFSIFYGEILRGDVAFWGGFTLSIIGILQHSLDLNNPRLHTALNVALVIGVSVMRLGSEWLNDGLTVSLYSLALSLYLVLARIELSQLDHRLICEECNKDVCQYSYVEM